MEVLTQMLGLSDILLREDLSCSVLSHFPKTLVSTMKELVTLLWSLRIRTLLQTSGSNSSKLLS